MPDVRTEVRDGVAHLVLCRPERRNALGAAGSAELAAAVAAAEDDPAVGAIVLAAEGRAFSAGGDLAELERADEAGLRDVYAGFLRVARSTVPTIAAVGGPAVGAGMNLALCCDLRLASPSARFACRFLDLGLHPGGGHAWMLERLIGRQGVAAMLLFGESLDGEQAVERGLAWRCVPDDDLVQTAHAMAQRIAAVPEELRWDVLETVREARQHGYHADAVERELVKQLRSKQRPLFAERIAAARRRDG